MINDKEIVEFIESCEDMELKMKLTRFYMSFLYELIDAVNNNTYDDFKRNFKRDLEEFKKTYMLEQNK